MNLSHSEYAFLLGLAIAFGPGVVIIITMVLIDAWRDWRKAKKTMARDKFHGEIWKVGKILK